MKTTIGKFSLSTSVVKRLVGYGSTNFELIVKFEVKNQTWLNLTVEFGLKLFVLF